jgi:cytochrome c oxidase assembly protein Cox11
MTTSSENDKEPETMRRLLRRCIAVAVVSIAISMFVSAVPAAQAAPVHCTVTNASGTIEDANVTNVEVHCV